MTVDGRTCQADDYSVAYDRLGTPGQLESVLERDEGTQFRIVCGGTTTTCRLDQPLAACVADMERRARSDDDDGGYTPPY